MPHSVGIRTWESVIGLQSQLSESAMSRLDECTLAKVDND